jgi:MobA/MobL family
MSQTSPYRAFHFLPSSKGRDMAVMRLARTVYKSGARKASSRIDYITGRRVLERDSADRQLRYSREGREDLVAEGTRNLPAWAEGNPHSYFRAAEQCERSSPGNEQRRGIAFEEWKISLPLELSKAQNLALVEDLIDAIAGKSLPCTYAFHNPQTLDGNQEQPHIHLLISARITDGIPRTPETHFKRYNRHHPERGGAQKDPAFWHKGAVKAHRVLVADLLNLHLERAGHVARVHPQSLAEQGIDRAPEPKLLPSESRAYRERGEVSERMGEVLRIRAERAAQRTEEQDAARRYWEHRKTELGITASQPRTVQLKAIVKARQHTRDHAPVRLKSQHHQQDPIPSSRTKDQAGHQARHPVLRHLSPARSGTLAQQFQRLARHLVQEDEVQGSKLHVRLYEEEHARDQGRGL